MSEKDIGSDALADGKELEKYVGKKPKRKLKRGPKVTTHYPLAEIIWNDASGLRHGWMYKADKLEPQLVMSVGFIIDEDEDHVVYASDTDSEGAHNGRTQIPRGMIQSMRLLRKPSYKNGNK